MSTNTTNYTLVKPELTDKIENTIPALSQNFEKIDVQMKNSDTQIQSLASGSPKGVYETLVALQMAKPEGDTSIYLVTEDGHWYYWNGLAWTDGGAYQATTVAAAGTTIADVDEYYDATDVEGALKEAYLNLGAHKTGTMPHQLVDLKNTKTYKFGFQLSAEGNPQIIFEEVV